METGRSGAAPPHADVTDLVFAVELLITGLLIGLMYSMVALGFVLIFKASAVFNFAQGAMTLLAALTLVGFMSYMNLWMALALTLAVMGALAIAAERWVFRPLVG